MPRRPILRGCPKRKQEVLQVEYSVVKSTGGNQAKYVIMTMDPLWKKDVGMPSIVGRYDVQVIAFALHDIYLFYEGIEAVYIASIHKTHGKHMLHALSGTCKYAHSKHRGSLNPWSVAPFPLSCYASSMHYAYPCNCYGVCIISTS